MLYRFSRFLSTANNPLYGKRQLCSSTAAISKTMESTKVRVAVEGCVCPLFLLYPRYQNHLVPLTRTLRLD